MGDHLEVLRGRKPWQPTAETRIVATYNYYDHPTAGVLESHGVKHVFTCVEGVADVAGVWTYTHATDAEIQELESLPSDQLHAALMQFMAHHPTVVAIALEDHGIVASTQQEPQLGSIDDPRALALGTALAFVERLRAETERLTAAV
jgi:methionyl-tRNA formyltransferase